MSRARGLTRDKDHDTALLAGICAVHGRSTRGIGKPTEIGVAPWLVQFDYVNPYVRGDFSGLTTCAGTIVDSLHILSAAHCFDDKDDEFPVGHVRALVGSTDKKGDGQAYHIKSIERHRGIVDDHNEKYDLAVVTLFEPMKFSDKVQPIAFIKTAVPANAIVSGGGWGTQPDESFAPTLLTWNLKKEEPAHCARSLSHSNVNKDSQGALMCMEPQGAMPCAGDSGSGLWQPATGGQPAKLVGVLHGGTVCDADKGSALYVDILHEDVRPFLSKYFDMSGLEVTKSAGVPAPGHRMVGMPQGLEGLLQGLGQGSSQGLPAGMTLTRVPQGQAGGQSSGMSDAQRQAILSQLPKELQGLNILFA